MVQGTNSLRRSALWGAIAFGLAMALIVGLRLEKAALTAVVGVICGVGASIPTSLLVVTLLQKRDNRRERGNRRFGGQPPVVVVTPQSTPQFPPRETWPEEYTLPAQVQRKFSVIGEDETAEL